MISVELRDLETKVPRRLHHWIEVGDARVVDESRHRVHGASVHFCAVLVRGDDADTVGLHDAERLEDIGVCDVGQAEVVPDEGRETGDPYPDAVVEGPVGFDQSQN